MNMNIPYFSTTRNQLKRVMKVLSIIGIVISLVGIMAGIFTIAESGCYCYCPNEYDSYSGYGGSNYSSDSDAVVGGMFAIGVSFFFLIFSIIATVVSFKRKTPAVPFQPPFQPPFQQPYQQQNYQQPPFPPQQPNYQQPPYPPQQPPYNPGGNSNIQP
jgi:hypothetical protein